MLTRLLNRHQRTPWQVLLPTLTWWRVRYTDALVATKGLQTVAANLPNNLLAISWQPQPLPTLSIGLPAGQHWCSAALRPYAVWLSREPTADALVSTTVTRWRQGTHWSADSQWTGLLSGDQLYMEANHETPTDDTVVWPAPNGQHPATWQLPTPVLGTAAQLAPEPVQPLPSPLSTKNNRLSLGSNANTPVFAPARVQVWGDRASLHRWTLQLILHELKKATHPIVVIDGRGDMAAQLPLYKPFVSTLKQAQLHYVHTEDELRQHGFNPLQPLAWETVEQTAARWQRWLDSLGIWPSGIALDTHQLCLHAVNSRVNNLSTLSRWLHQVADIPQTAYTHIQRALRQVQQDTQYATWLRRPRPLFERPLGLVFACAIGSDAVKRTMTAALLDAALTLPEVTLVLMGVPNELLQRIPEARLPRRVVMVNGVMLQGGVVGIGRITNPHTRQQMVTKAFGNDPHTSTTDMFERLTIAPSDSVFWITSPPVQTTA